MNMDLYAIMVIVGIPLLLIACIGGLFLLYRLKLPRPSWRPVSNRPPVQEFSQDAVTVTWLGHSTVYLNIKGVRILTDPVFSERVGVQIPPGFTIGPKRYTPPALDVDEVGSVDWILLSHAHMDHLDLPSLRALARPDTRVVTPRGTKKLIQSYPFGEIIEAERDESIYLGEGLYLTAFPVRHWGNRYPWNVDYGYNGYLMEKEGHRIVFTGDTAYTPTLKRLCMAGPIDLILMPIGAYSPDSLQRAHCTPEQAWRMVEEAGAAYVVPVHWNTFVLSREPVDEPIQRFLQAAGTEQDRIVIRRQGEVWQLEKSTSTPQKKTKELQLQT